MTIGVALIGSGIFPQDQHLPAILACRNLLSLKAIYSRSSRSAQALASTASEKNASLDIDVYGDDAGEGRSYKDLLDREDVQSVIIALPIEVQPGYIRKALKAGKHVLSEKPIAKDLVTARELLDWYYSSDVGEKYGGGDYGRKIFGGTWSVAENFRFLESFIYAAKRIGEMGRVLGFNVRMATFVRPGDKYFETSWRKNPSHQGGFLLDAGVHFTAGIRFLLASASAGGGTCIKHLSAHTAQLQPHLPPADTVDATMKTNTGVTGSFSLSFGTTLPEVFEYNVACELGSITVREGLVAVRKEGGEEAESRDFPDEGEGVIQEVEAWAKGIVEGGKTELNKRQSPEEALADLEMLDAMLRSGEKGGEPVQLELQEVRN